MRSPLGMTLITLMLSGLGTSDTAVRLDLMKVRTGSEMATDVAGIIAVIASRMTVQAIHRVSAGPDRESHVHVGSLPLPAVWMMADLAGGAGNMIRHRCQRPFEIFSVAAHTFIRNHIVGMRSCVDVTDLAGKTPMLSYKRKIHVLVNLPGILK
jgi:hypothetical protein